MTVIYIIAWALPILYGIFAMCWYFKKYEWFVQPSAIPRWVLLIASFWVVWLIPLIVVGWGFHA